MDSLKKKFETQIRTLGVQNAEMEQTIRVLKKNFNTADLSVKDLLIVAFMKASVEGKDQVEGEMFAWRLFKQRLSDETLMRIAETEFTESINKLLEK